MTLQSALAARGFLVALIVWAGLLSSGTALAEGAVATGIYRNLFQETAVRHSDAEIDAKLDLYWRQLFEGDAAHRVFFPAAPNGNGPTAYILDVGNNDIRSEGISYGMMIAVQMDRKAAFDALWNWAHTHMRYASGPRTGYFRWQCTPDGCPADAVPASDGEEYIVTALFFAAHRWGNGDGIYDYEAQGNALLNHMLHKEDMNGGVIDGVSNMFNHTHKQVVFVPVGTYAGFTDPSYHLPAFYELWGRWAEGWQGRQAQDRAFWREAAGVSRAFFARAAHPQTALTPDYSEFDGSPKAISGHDDFRFDAIRSGLNWSVDQAWWGADPGARARSDRLQAFFESRGLDSYESEFRLDGQPLTTSRSGALIATNGAVSIATDTPLSRAFTERLWDMEPPSGKYRYYDGLLQFMALLHASGRFRAW